MMRRLCCVLLALSGALACSKAPEGKGEDVSKPKVYEVSKGGKRVLTVTDAPGPIVSTAAPPPGKELPTHPFLSASAYAPEEEDALRRLLQESKSTQDFLDRLARAGYEVRPEGGPAGEGKGAKEAGPEKAYLVTKDARPVVTLREQPGQRPLFSSSSFSAGEEAELKKLLDEAKTTEQFLEALRKKGYSVKPGAGP